MDKQKVTIYSRHNRKSPCPGGRGHNNFTAFTPNPALPRQLRCGKRLALCRCFLLLTLFFWPAGGQHLQAQESEPSPTGTIVALGDSLTEGFGLGQADAYPAQLERRLQQAGLNWRVINAGVSGETSSGTLSRMDWILKLNPDIVLLATGANDGLRGLDPDKLRENLDQMIRKFQGRGISVVLLGMRMVPNLGREYLAAFKSVYRDLAAAHNLIFMPFMLEGIAMDPVLNQADGIHPTPRGYGVLARNLFPYVQKAINARQNAAPQ
ncbi:MAG: arylesterase [Desulfobacterales bacterium]